MAESEDNLLVADQTATQTNWKDSVAEEHRSGIAKFSQVGDLAQGYLELEKSASSKIKLPAAESSEEELSAFYDKIGRPENPEGYEITLPEGETPDEEFITTMRNIAHKSGVPKIMFESLVKGYLEFLDGRLHRSQEEGERTLHQDWGANYDANLAIAQRACKHFGGDDFVKLMKDTGLGNHPVFVKTFLEIGKVNLDDTLIKGAPTGKEEYVPKYKDSPEMYATGEDEESKKARAYFEARGHKY